MKLFIRCALFFLCSLSPLFSDDRLLWLKTDGADIVTEQGQPVVLRGINLGGWLVEEMWMLPFKVTPENERFEKIKDHKSLWHIFERRFGKRGVEKIKTAFRKTWITEDDFVRIQAAGLNVVRVPFLYDVYDEPTGLFVHLDRIINAASKHNIYVILDMHGAPGRQSSKQHTGQEDENRLFYDPEMVKKTCEIWGKIAERYKGRSVIAGYDLLNEPMGTPDVATLCLVQERIYREIRKHDERHIVIMEDGFKGLDRMPNPAICDWQNVVFSTHTYNHKKEKKTEFEQSVNALLTTLALQKNLFKTPVYLGEFNVVPFGDGAMVESIIKKVQAKGISWSLWTYKAAGSKVGKNSLWALYLVPTNAKKINPFKDSLDEVLKKIEKLDTKHCELNNELLNIFWQTKP